MLVFLRHLFRFVRVRLFSETGLNWPHDTL